MKSISLALLMALGASANGGETFRTDINPALLYYKAFILAPDWSPADRDYLFNSDWRGKKLPERFGELVAGYDNQFRFVRQARHSTVACDWGLDLSPGPGTLLPHLARNKGIAQGGRLRAMWDLQNGKEAEAREDLLAAFALGRNGSRDGTLISALVQIAVENIVYSTVAENFYRFSPETLKELVEGLDSAPARGTMAASMLTEKASFHGWMVDRVLDLQKENPGNDAKVMAAIREIFKSIDATDEGLQTNRWTQVFQASGGTSEGILKMLRDEDAYYQRVTEIFALPPSDFEVAAKELSATIRNTTNPMVALTFPAFEKARPKEIAVEVSQAMVRAAVAYKLDGETGLQSVPDPAGQGPFELQRFVFEGADRGFQLKSVYAARGFPEVLIFVEKDGPPFNVNGAKAGKATSP